MRSLVFFVVLLTALVAACSSGRAEVTLDFSTGLNPPPNPASAPQSLGGQGGGQTFSPGDVPGIGDATTLDLTGFSFWRGNGGTGPSQVSETTFLVIYDGNPDSFDTVQVGSSSTSVNVGINDATTIYNVALESTHETARYDWEFDDLTLDVNTTYWAVFSNSPTDNNILQSNGGAGVGTWLQMSLQMIENSGSGSDPSAYQGGVSIIANRNPHNSGFQDVRFVATFADPTGTTPGTPGDYNGDEVVNAADYTIWRDSLDSVGPDLPADGDDDMDVDADDYLIWRNAFLASGTGDGGGGGDDGGIFPGPASIPEPASTAVLLIAGVVGLARARLR